MPSSNDTATAAAALDATMEHRPCSAVPKYCTTRLDAAPAGGAFMRPLIAPSTSPTTSAGQKGKPLTRPHTTSPCGVAASAAPRRPPRPSTRTRSAGSDSASCRPSSNATVCSSRRASYHSTEPSTLRGAEGQPPRASGIQSGRAQRTRCSFRARRRRRGSPRRPCHREAPQRWRPHQQPQPPGRLPQRARHSRRPPQRQAPPRQPEAAAAAPRRRAAAGALAPCPAAQRERCTSAQHGASEHQPASGRAPRATPPGRRCRSRSAWRRWRCSYPRCRRTGSRRRACANRHAPAVSNHPRCVAGARTVATQSCASEKRATAQSRVIAAARPVAVVHNCASDSAAAHHSTRTWRPTSHSGSTVLASQLRSGAARGERRVSSLRAAKTAATAARSNAGCGAAAGARTGGTCAARSSAP